MSIHRYAGAPASQYLIWADASELVPAAAVSFRSHSSSLFVVSALGGGATRSAFPDAMIHVFQFPAFGSTRGASAAAVIPATAIIQIPYLNIVLTPPL